MPNGEFLGHLNLRRPNCLFIGGRWVAPVADGRTEIVSPVTEQIIGTVADAGEADVDAAVMAARHAFDNGVWSKLFPDERGGYIRKLAAGLRARSTELGYAWSDQIGVIYSFAQQVGGFGAATLDYYADLAASYQWEERHVPEAGGSGLLVREPVGVVAAITPWNGPFQVMINKIAPALIAGCTVIMKPAPETPLEAYIIAEVAEEVDFPPGVINLLVAGREVADYLVRQPGVDKVSFTGSTLAGRRIASVCGERIARVTLELGGKSAAIITDGYDLEKAAARLTEGLNLVSGQVCAALTRVVVPRARHDEFVEAFATYLRDVNVGDPYDAQTEMGPLAMKRQFDRVMGYISKGIGEGATLVTGGRRPAHLNRGCFVEPTLFADADNSMSIAREEIFGPVATVIPYDNEEHAIAIANESIYGLNGAVFTDDPDRAYRIARRIRSGTFGQNGLRMDWSIAFGGFKQSGIGREGGKEGLLPYLEAKTILLDGAPSHVSK